MKKRLQRPTAPEKPTKPKLGRPITRRIKLDATPAEVAQAMFAAARKANPPDPSIRRFNKPEDGESED